MKELIKVIAFDADDTLWSLSLIHISEPTRRTPISYAVFCLKKKKHKDHTQNTQSNLENRH